jgi:hypothetical protein
MAMNMNFLVSCFGTSLRGFFEFCEKETDVKACDLNSLFNQYFAINGNSESDDEDASSSKKAPTIKKAAVKKTPTKEASPNAAARKGKGKEAKPRDEQTPVGDLDLNKKKLPELKEYARERDLRVSGTKAQLIENILNYEKERGSPAENLEAVEEEDLGIQIKKPKTKGKKVCEPADKPKYEVEEKHGVKMIYYSRLDRWFVLNDKNVVVGWANSDDEANAEEDECIDIRALDKDACEVAKDLGLDFEVPENLDS